MAYELHKIRMSIEEMLDVIEKKFVEPEKRKWIAKDAEGNRE